MERQNIIIHGLFSSGSSAAIDLLREYEEIEIVPGEFDEFRRIGMIGDTLNSYRTDQAPPSILEDYIEKNKSKYEKNIFSYYLDIKNVKTILKFGENYKRKYKLERLNILETLQQEFQKLDKHEERVQATKEWLQEVGDLYIQKQSVGNILFDHGIDTFDHRDIWPTVFDPFKLIIVFRDPRDQLGNMIKRGHLYWELGLPRTSGQTGPVYHGNCVQAIYGRGRSAIINLYIDSTKKKFTAIEELYKEHGRDKVMMIDFEELVTKPEEYSGRLERFLGIHKRKESRFFTHFDPKKSNRNIELYKTYLKKDELSLLKDLMKDYQRFKEQHSL